MKCSIVILNWNGEEMLRRYLPSVVAHCPADCEVVVADNGSTDASVALLHKDFPEVRLVLFTENYGFAEGYNKALQQVESEYVVLLNSDVRVTPHWLTPMLDYMAAHPEVAAVQPKVLAEYDREKKVSDAHPSNKADKPKVSEEHPSNKADKPKVSEEHPSNKADKPLDPILFEHAGAAGGFMDQLGYPYCRGRIMGRLELDCGQYDAPERIFWATGACLLTRREVFLKVGGLDADFFAHMEEIDFCWRLNARGYQLMCLPGSTVYHLGGGALPYESPRKTYLNFRNCLLMLYKNQPWWRLLWLMPARCVLDYVAALQYLLKGQRANAHEVLHARKDYRHLRPKMRAKRRDNMRHTTQWNISTITPFSILWHFYFLRHQRFNQFLNKE